MKALLSDNIVTVVVILRCVNKHFFIFFCHYKTAVNKQQHFKGLKQTYPLRYDVPSHSQGILVLLSFGERLSFIPFIEDRVLA